MARGLYPVRLKTEGLGPALAELSGIVGERFGIQCVCDPQPAVVQCDMTTATHLYRIAQEAVNNAIKHSGARNISLLLSVSPDGIDLEVKDDGKGMDDAATRHTGMGLHIMDYRARSLGGNLYIHSDGSGTLVSCHVPQKPDESKP